MLSFIRNRVGARIQAPRGDTSRLDGRGAVVLPPPRTYFEVNRAADLRISALAAVTTVAGAMAGMTLPRWGSSDTGRRAWQLHIASAVMPAIGLIGAVITHRRARESFADVSSGPWIQWAIANVVAVFATLIGALVRWRRTSTLDVVKLSIPDADYFAAIVDAKARALREIDALRSTHPTEVVAVDGAWHSGIELARRNGRLTGHAADSARKASAFRWLVELVADPDFKPAQHPDGRGLDAEAMTDLQPRRSGGGLQRTHPQCHRHRAPKRTRGAGPATAGDHCHVSLNRYVVRRLNNAS